MQNLNLNRFLDFLNVRYLKPGNFLEYTYFTNGYEILRFKIENESLPVHPLSEQLVKFFDEAFEFTLKLKNSDIVNLLEQCPKVKPPCEECDGTGEVTWEYYHHKKDDDCPECDGSGVNKFLKKRVPDINFVFKIEDLSLSLRTVESIIHLMNATGIDEIDIQKSADSTKIYAEIGKFMYVTTQVL